MIASICLRFKAAVAAVVRIGVAVLDLNNHLTSNDRWPISVWGIFSLLGKLSQWQDCLAGSLGAHPGMQGCEGKIPKIRGDRNSQHISASRELCCYSPCPKLGPKMLRESENSNSMQFLFSGMLCAPHGIEIWDDWPVVVRYQRWLRCVQSHVKPPTRDLAHNHTWNLWVMRQMLCHSRWNLTKTFQPSSTVIDKSFAEDVVHYK